MTSNFLSLNPAKTDFLIIGFPAQFTKFHNPILTIPFNTTIQLVSFARNLGAFFDSNLSFSDHIFYMSKSLWNALPHHICSHFHSSQSQFSSLTIFYTIA